MGSEQSGDARPRRPPNGAGRTPESPLDGTRAGLTLVSADAAAGSAPPVTGGEADRVPRLPVPLSSLLGRDDEVAAVTAKFRAERRRLVTLTGPGGVGKTRLALAAAAGMAGDFAAGVSFVPLAPVHDAALVPAVIARALGLLGGTEPATAQLLRYLRDRHQLLVLDNLEHLLDVSPQIATLLAGCPRLAVLATSRERLRLDGEHELPVPPLAVPDRVRQSTAGALAGNAAVRLFVERAREVVPTFALTDDNGYAVAEICRRVDGLPLAIELAAARAKVLPPPALLARLERRLPLLIGAQRDAPERQRTLRHAIVWSHDLLAPAEQALFRRLGVFVGGFTLEAAEAVIQTLTADNDAEGHRRLDEQPTTLDLIESLVDKSLLHGDARAGGPAAAEPRFAMLETVREFALEQMEASGEGETARRAHAAYFLTLADRAEPEVVGRDQGRWLGRLDAEIDNLRATLTWALAEGEGRTEAGLQLTGALWTFWYMSGRNREGRDWLERVLATSDGTLTFAWARALLALGTICGTLSDFARAEPVLAEAVAAWRALGNASGTGRSLQMLAVTVQQQGDHERAVPLLEEILTLYGPPGQGAAEDQPWLGLALDQLADALISRGEVDRAVALAEQALALQQTHGSRPGVAFGLLHFAHALAANGEDARALAAYQESIAVLWEQGDRWDIMFGLPWILGLAVKHVPAEQVARLIGAFDALRAEIGHPLPPRHVALHEQVIATARAALGPAAYDAAQAEGRAQSLAQAIAEVNSLAISVGTGLSQARLNVASPFAMLTPREAEVLRLIAAGYSNQQIAATLFISARTASTHAANILGKLGLSSRAEAIASAHRHGLT